MSPYAAIVLAAGLSSRFEHGHKLLAEIGGTPLIRRTLEAVSASSIGDVILVLAPGTQQAILSAAGAGRWRAVINENAAEGLSTSLRAGVAALPQHTRGALVVLADMPGCTPELIDRLLQASAQFPQAIVYPVSEDGQQGHPVLWPSDIFPQFAELTGDQGGKPLLRRHAHRIVTIPAGNEAIIDIDTAEDLAAFSKR